KTVRPPKTKASRVANVVWTFILFARVDGKLPVIHGAPTTLVRKAEITKVRIPCLWIIDRYNQRLQQNPKKRHRLPEDGFLTIPRVRRETGRMPDPGQHSQFVLSIPRRPPVFLNSSCLFRPEGGKFRPDRSNSGAMSQGEFHEWAR